MFRSSACQKIKNNQKIYRTFFAPNKNHEQNNSRFFFIFSLSSKD
ncbi:hypothetical protein CF65_00918 [Aggregatibacter actinomycetemcomitans HK1651]|nr:hypothetical protein CF65_00918 [Aggregatibacter actinomycetemcomitans HK1651]